LGAIERGSFFLPPDFDPSEAFLTFRLNLAGSGTDGVVEKTASIARRLLEFEWMRWNEDAQFMLDLLKGAQAGWSYAFPTQPQSWDWEGSWRWWWWEFRISPVKGCGWMTGAVTQGVKWRSKVRK